MSHEQKTPPLDQPNLDELCAEARKYMGDHFDRLIGQFSARPSLTEHLSSREPLVLVAQYVGPDIAPTPIMRAALLSSKAHGEDYSQLVTEIRANELDEATTDNLIAEQTLILPVSLSLKNLVWYIGYLQTLESRMQAYSQMMGELKTEGRRLYEAEATP